MSFLFVDRITELLPGKRATGIKHVTPSEPYLIKTEDDQLKLLSPIIGEALGQLSAWCIMQANNFTMRPIAGIVNKVTISADAYLGDTIVLQTYIDSWDTEAVAYHSVASIAGKEIFVIESAIGPMMPMLDFIDEKTVRQQFNQIYRPGHLAELVNGETYLNVNNIPPCRDAFYDQIVSWGPDCDVIAQKKISITAPFLKQHFPRKPVMPLTILLICNVDLAYRYLAKHLTPKEIGALKIKRLLRVKMNKFVEPGSVLTTTMRVEKRSPQNYRFRFQSRVDGIKVCIAKVEFASS